MFLSNSFFNWNENLQILNLSKNLPIKFESKYISMFFHHFQLVVECYLPLFIIFYHLFIFITFISFVILVLKLLFLVFIFVIIFVSFIVIILTSSFFILLLFFFIILFSFQLDQQNTYQNFFYNYWQYFILLSFDLQRSQYFFLRSQILYQRIHQYFLSVEWWT